jgi:hypothetical protein
MEGTIMLNPESTFTPSERPTEPFNPSQSIAPASGIITVSAVEYEETTLLLTLSFGPGTVLSLYKQTGIPARVILRTLEKLLDAGKVKYEKHHYAIVA